MSLIEFAPGNFKGVIEERRNEPAPYATADEAFRAIHASLAHGVQVLLEEDDWQGALTRATAMRSIEKHTEVTT